MGSLATTLANDYKIADDTETVTLRDVSASTNTTVTNADGHDFSVKEVAAAGGMFGLGDRQWVLGCNQIAAANQPAPGDYLTDAGGTIWEILDAVQDDFKISWVCTCKKKR
jgi:hypothetical protein